LTNRFVSAKTISIKCLVNWILLRIRVRSRNPQPHLKGGPEPSKEIVLRMLVPRGLFHFSLIPVPKKIDCIIPPGAFGDLDEVCAEVSELAGC